MTSAYILLVEDNPNDEALTIRALKKHGIVNDIRVVRDGAEAFAHLFPEHGTQSTIPSLILLDLKLPKVGGLEVLRRIRDDERTRFIPVVILTSSNEEQDVLAGYVGGANAFVRKPVEFSAFVDSVGRLGMFWMLINEPPPLSRPPGSP